MRFRDFIRDVRIKLFGYPVVSDHSDPIIQILKDENIFLKEQIRLFASHGLQQKVYTEEDNQPPDLQINKRLTLAEKRAKKEAESYQRMRVKLGEYRKGNPNG